MESNNICSRCGAHGIEQPDYSLLCEHCGTVHFSEERKRKILEQRQREAAQRAAQEQAERNRLAEEERARHAAERAAQWQITKKKICKAVLISIPCLVLAAVLVVVGTYIYFYISYAPVYARKEDFQHIAVGDVISFGHHGNGEPAQWRVVGMRDGQYMRTAVLLAEEIFHVPSRIVVSATTRSFARIERQNDVYYAALSLSFDPIDHRLISGLLFGFDRHEIEREIPNASDRSNDQLWLLRPGWTNQYAVDVCGTIITVDRPSVNALVPVRPAFLMFLN
jgi:hypothetical protein